MTAPHAPGKPARLPRREIEEVREVDPDGRIVVHGRLVDSLGRMLKSGAIDQPMYDVARDFQAAFFIANLDPIRAVPILRVSGAGREPDLSERQLDARRRVHAAMRALGGIGSPAGSCVWHVLGLQRSVREWATRQGWNGRPVRQEQAQGILVAALGMLASSGGHCNARQPSQGTIRAVGRASRGYPFEAPLNDLGLERGGCDEERSG